MGARVAALLQRQFLKLHTSALQSLAVTRYQTACTRWLVPWCMAVEGYQTACARACPAMLQWQVLKQSNCFIE
jgi:hypothetical protein